MIATKSTTRRKRNIFGAFKGKFVELVPDPFNTGYDEMKRLKELKLEAQKRKQA